jgi:hypothetical protein
VYLRKINRSGAPFLSATGEQKFFLELRGDYTVRARFRETFRHPHRLYGPAIANNNEPYLYCAASGDGTFVVGGAGALYKPFQLNGSRPQPHPAVHRAVGPGMDVEQEIALSLSGGVLRCAINGTVVASYDASAIIAPGRLDSLDDVYFGVRVGADTDVLVTELTATQSNGATP